MKKLLSNFASVRATLEETVPLFQDIPSYFFFLFMFQVSLLCVIKICVSRNFKFTILAYQYY